MNALRLKGKIPTVFILLCANVVNNIVTFAVNVLLAKSVGPEKFGIFSLAVSLMLMVHFIFDIGLNLTLVRFYNIYQKDRGYQQLLLTSLLVLRFAILAFLLIGSFIVAPVLTRMFDLPPMYSPLVVIAIVTGGVLTLWVYFQSYMQARGKFMRLSSHILGYAGLRILFLVLLFFSAADPSDLTLTLAALYSLPAVIIVLISIVPVCFRVLDLRSLFRQNIISPLKEVLKYSKWVALASISYNLILRAIQFVLALRTSTYELGILSAGFVFTVAFSTLNMAIRAVFFPHVTAFEKIGDMKAYYAQIKAIGPYYVFFAVISIGLLALVQVTLLGHEYTKALPVFLITAGAFSLVIFLGLWSMMVHTFMHPEIDAIVNIVRLVAACVLAYVLSPRFGAVGGAFAYALPLVLGEFFMVVYVRKLLHGQ
ncbi:oligosaccharide flippase family protein [candidate division WOR-3 bacterium]|nr:oligosaccharide flippase family protein [candidate division WOR-3 bacterium]